MQDLADHRAEGRTVTAGVVPSQPETIGQPPRSPATTAAFAGRSATGLQALQSKAAKAIADITITKRFLPCVTLR